MIKSNIATAVLSALVSPTWYAVSTAAVPQNVVDGGPSQLPRTTSDQAKTGN